jgi:hypothetical protein
MGKRADFAIFGFRVGADRYKFVPNNIPALLKEVVL